MSLAFDPSATPPLGRLGKYELQEEIGRGGMGIVYRGYDTLLKRAVAIKVLAPALSADPHFIQRFQKEAITAANLDHPNILTIYDVGQAGDTYFIVMELLTGVPLNRWVQARGPLSLPQANGVIKQVASALDYAHRRSVVHCDVKPVNIMLNPDNAGHITLMDFGLVRARESKGQSGELAAGTPEYMAPEQVLGQPVDPRTDVYACGAVLYYLLTGQALFERAAPAAVVYAQVNEPPPPLRKLRPDLPRPVEAVITKALAKPPAERYQSAGALAADFAVAIANRTPPGLKRTPAPGVLPPKASASEPVKASGVPSMTAGEGGAVPAGEPVSSRQPPVPVMAAILVMLIALVGGLAWVLTRSSQVQPAPPAGGASQSLTATAAQATAQQPAGIVAPSSTTLMRPTATLAARATSTPTPSATPEVVAPAPTPTPTLLAAPRLVAPENDISVSDVTVFQWEWDGVLAPGQAFEVRLWKDGSSEHPGAHEVVAPAAGGRVQQRIDLRQAPAVRRGGSGVYWWTVAVVSVEPYQRIGPEAAPRRLYYGGG